MHADVPAGPPRVPEPSEPPALPEHLAGMTAGPGGPGGTPAANGAQNRADSAGVPWAGRDLKPNPFAGDTGLAVPALTAALDAVTAAPLDPAGHRGVLEALRGARVYAPILPTAIEHTTDARGLVHDNSSEMAMVRLAADDGRECTPCFSDIPALTAWGTTARPVPIESERLCVAAIEEGAQLVVVDPGSAHPFLLRRTALWAFVQGLPWTPAWADSAVAEAVGRVVDGLGWIAAIGIAPGSRAVHVSGPELALVLTVERTPTPEELADLRRRLGADEDFVSRVDSMVITVDRGRAGV